MTNTKSLSHNRTYPITGRRSLSFQPVGGYEIGSNKDVHTMKFNTLRLLAIYLLLATFSSPSSGAEEGKVTETGAATDEVSKPESGSPSKKGSKEQKWLLQYQFQMGEVLRYQVHHMANVRTTIEETTQQVESKSDSIKAWKVTDVLPDGSMEFVHVVEHVRMSNKTPSRPWAEYDSQHNKTPPVGFEQAARSVGVPISVIRLAPTGEILAREEKIPQPGHTPDMPITVRLPDSPIGVGTKWNDSYQVRVQRKSGANLKIQTRRHCKLLKVQHGIATFRVDYQILTPVDAYTESQLVERLTKGTVRFDLEKGRIVSQEMAVDRRVLGFSGGTSSMHFISKLEERLLGPNEKLARR
jgi:hypothetical protein